MLKLITPAASTPIDLTTLKAHLAIDGTDHDTRLTALLTAATAYCETETNRAFVSQTWELTLPRFPCVTTLELPKPPLSSVTSVVYYDTTNAQQTLSSGLYRVHTNDGRGLIEIIDTWPDTYCPRINAVTVRFVAGYSTQPAEVCHAIKLLCGAWNELREGEVMGSTKPTELGVTRLLGHLSAMEYR